MKLLVVGSAPQSNICLSSAFVSGYHADIVLLDNGDIFIVDKGSTNGTYVNGSRVTPGVEVPVRRGEQVMFADSPLDWGRVPSIPVDPSAKRLISIGTHNRNTVKLSGNKVSRFHATIKETNDGKWYICDHSTNGTVVDGNRLPKDVYMRLKPGASIVCAGVPVENPAKGGYAKKGLIAGIASGCVLVVAAVLFAVLYPWPKNLTDEQIHDKYASSVVLLHVGYHYKVTAGALDVEDMIGFDEFVPVLEDNGRVEFVKWDRYASSDSKAKSIEGLGTGFFISESGLIATNRHVAEPWQYVDYGAELKEQFKILLNNKGIYNNTLYLNFLADVKVEGVFDFAYAIPNNSYANDDKNAVHCIKVAASSDTNIDVALLRTTIENGKLPSGTTAIDIKKMVPSDYDYKTGSHVYTLGFPVVSDLSVNLNNKPLNANGSAGAIQNQISEYTFGHSAIIAKGASGSPMFNSKGQLIGIVVSSDALNVDYKHAVKIEYLMDLLKDKRIKY